MGVSADWWVVSGKCAILELRSFAPLHYSPLTTHLSPLKSWWRRWEDFFVLRIVFRAVVAGGNNRQVIVHLIPRENLAELGDKPVFRQMAGELLEVLDVVRRSVPDQVAERAFLLGLCQAGAD